MKPGKMSLKGLLRALDVLERPDEGTVNPNIIALTQGEGWRVSTVYLWDDDDGTPAYESMAFPDDSFHDMASARYSSKEEAEKGHDAMVSMMKTEGPALLAKWRSEQ